MSAVLPTTEEFPYVIRVVSEITESNGSSSMASVCGTSLALMEAGVPVKAPVAGIAMGLIKEGDRFAVLSDILGDEDHLGDMDFKVAGTADGITALQMDIKITGVTKEIMEQALDQALGFAVGLRPVRSGLLHGGAGPSARLMPEPGPVAGSVVGDDPFTIDAECGVESDGSGPEPGCGCGLFVRVDLGVDDAGAVVEGGMQVYVARTRVTAVCVVASSVHAPAAAIGDGRQFLDIDVDQLAWTFPLIAADRFVSRCSITHIQASHSGLIQDALHGRSSQPHVMGDPLGALTSLPTEPDHPTSYRPRSTVRGPMRPRRPVHQTSIALDKEPVPPLTHRLGIDLEPSSGRLNRPTTIQDTTDHPSAPLRRQRRIRMLPQSCSVSHEPSSRVVSRTTHSLAGRAHPITPPRQGQRPRLSHLELDW